jgi:hypothetical protein
MNKLAAIRLYKPGFPSDLGPTLKSEIRISKSETNSKFENLKWLGRDSCDPRADSQWKADRSRTCVCRPAVSNLFFFGFVSDFDIRISDFVGIS